MESSKSDGFKDKYIVERTDGKPVGRCLILEFKDPITHPAIVKWAKDMRLRGYEQVYSDVMAELLPYLLNTSEGYFDNE